MSFKQDGDTIRLCSRKIRVNNITGGFETERLAEKSFQWTVGKLILFFKYLFIHFREEGR